MDINIQQLVLNPANDDWWKILIGAVLGFIASSVTALIASKADRKNRRYEIHYQIIFEDFYKIKDLYATLVTMCNYGKYEKEDSIEYDAVVKNCIEFRDNMYNFKKYSEKWFNILTDEEKSDFEEIFNIFEIQETFFFVGTSDAVPVRIRKYDNKDVRMKNLSDLKKDKIISDIHLKTKYKNEIDDIIADLDNRIKKTFKL